MPNSNFLCLFILLAGYCICSITLGFVICSFFTRSKPATIAAILVWCVTVGPVVLSYDDISGWLKVLFCFCPNTAIFYAFKIIGRWENIGVGLNWTTAFQTTSVYDNLTIASIVGIFIGNACFLYLIALYVENVMPGMYGVAKPWYFIVSKDFWKKRFFRSDQIGTISNPNRIQSENANFESEPTNQPIGIETHNLTKSFTSNQPVVSNLSLNMYENQITALLGQNGAGKTTTISMLSGMIEPTSGTAIINGFDIRRDMDSARSSMGFCPQHNILFDELTVREHILFYGGLKGMNKHMAENEAKNYIRKLGLDDKKDARSSTLSGGMKRKLSVLIAFCGQSRVVFLDEPTSGMDPGARRALWKLLLEEKRGRTILLTTHFMDEADVLSDRIAILANGVLKCVGSTYFLKKRFGTGYHLICAKDKSCDSNEVTKLLSKHISDIRIESETENEVSYILPVEQIKMFTIIFSDLENNLSNLKLRGIGVSLSAFEEIFLKVGKLDKMDDISPDDTRIAMIQNRMLSNGCSLLMNQTFAMLKKRFLCWWRSWMTFACLNAFVIVLMSFIGLEFAGSNCNLPSLEINLDGYISPIVVLQNHSSTRYVRK